MSVALAQLIIEYYGHFPCFEIKYQEKENASNSENRKIEQNKEIWLHSC